MELIIAFCLICSSFAIILTIGTFTLKDEVLERVTRKVIGMGINATQLLILIALFLYF